MAVVGLVVVRVMSGSKERFLTVKNIVLMLCLVLLPAFMYNTRYTYFYTIMIYFITIVTYQQVLNIEFSKTVICCGIMFVFLFLLDFLTNLCLAQFLSVEQMRNTWYINLLINMIFIVILLVLFTSQKTSKVSIEFIDKISRKRQTNFVIFLILAIIAMSTLLYAIGNHYKMSTIFTTNFLLFLVFFLLVIILVGEKNSYEKLSDEYDTLFNYVKVFEDWIEDEQLIRHEYKNQLAVLRCFTKEKKVKEKIDEIVSEMINVDNHMIQELRNLPNGGFKGLLYYKMAVARKEKVNIEVDVSETAGKVLKKLTKEELKVISKLLGIYCDNAIEEAKKTRKKIVLIEIYEIRKRAKIVISNTYRKSKMLENRYEKGVSTKGVGRGKGLYFAMKMLSKNAWIKEKQEVIDGYYIETIEIDKKKRSK